jgi:chromosome segregation ATPase
MPQLKIQRSAQIWLLCLVLATPVSIARAADDESAREQCRKILAGHYLNLLDEENRRADLHERLSRDNSALERRLNSAQASFNQTKAKTAKNDYDVSLARQRDGWQNQIAAIKHQLGANNAEMARLEAERDSAHGATQNFVKQLEPVFELVKSEQAGGGYGIVVQYRHACQKFRTTCPLPTEQAAHLATIQVDGGTPTPCQHYSDQSKTTY